MTEGMNRVKETWLFIGSLLGMAVTGAVLILRIPALFDAGRPDNLGVVGALACLAVVFAVGALRRRSLVMSPDRR